MVGRFDITEVDNVERQALKVRLDWTRSNAKQPKFDVIDSSRKVATARNLSEQLRYIACLQAVVKSPTKSLIRFLRSQFARK